jgi:hypothetical protein
MGRSGSGRAVTGVLVLLATTLTATDARAAKTDIVVLENGDRITGEFKRIERGQLVWKTDSMGTVYIEWKDVVALQSEYYLQVELESGARYNGFAQLATDSRRLRLVPEDAGGESQEFLMDRVVRVARLDEGRLLDRFDGYANFGYDFTKASGVTQLTTEAGIRTRRKDYAWNVDGSLRITDSDDNPSSERALLGGGFTRFLQNRWFWRHLAQLESNDELGLELRALIGTGGGRYLVQTNEYEWAALAGLALTRENFQTGDSQESIELILGTDFSWFIYDFPKTDLSSSLFFLPNLTDTGRYRAETKIRARREIVSDLFFELSFYGSYDNEAAESAASDLDYGVNTSLGYSF